ncbi:energy transducer TonB [Oligella ureolytica]
MRVTVDEKGKLTDVNILSGGNPRLNRDLMRQLRQQLSFNPHKINGVARKARGDFSINIQVR